MEERLFTAKEAADFIKVFESTLATWRYLGKGPTYVKAGKIVRYRASDLEGWMKRNAVDPEAKTGSEGQRK